MNFLIKNIANKATKFLKESRDIWKSRPFRGNRIFYFGVPNHTNIGDLAQYVCIKKWMKQYFPDKYIVESYTDVLLDNRLSTLKIYKKEIKKNDLIFFQSGYCTHDLGGREDEMHRTVVENFPDNYIICMPQTIFYKSKERAEMTSRIYNCHNKMFLIARDYQSYDYAKNLFPKIHLALYPDIVTTLIDGNNIEEHQESERTGVLICSRKDIEKYYTEEEIECLKDKLILNNIPCDITDTTIDVPYRDIKKNIPMYIWNMIDMFSKYKVTVTDRYHGTIFSIIAKTPVIVIKSNDHKVITGIKWFDKWKNHGVYYAESLDDAERISRYLYQQTKTEIVYGSEFSKMYEKLSDEIHVWLKDNQ